MKAASRQRLVRHWGASSDRLRGLMTGTFGGLVGASLALVGWLNEPAALADPPPRPARAVPIAAAKPAPPEPELEAETEAEADEPSRDAWRKRPTPMTPEAAVGHLSQAWRLVFHEPPESKTIAVVWAQWALETGRGRWMVDYNFAGLKGRGPDGAFAWWWTWEETEAGPKRVRGRFRAYESASEGAEDYLRMLNARYPAAVVAARRGDARGFVQELERRGYFTEDPAAYEKAMASLSREFMRGPLRRRLR